MPNVGVVNTQFTPESTIYIYKGVPIDSVNNTFWGTFSNATEQKKFFDDNYEHIEFNDYTYQRVNGNVKVEKPYDDIRDYNYMIYRNGKTGNKAKWIYCFINQKGYISDYVTSITFETDVIQTYRFEIERNMLESFVAFEHRPQWYNDNGVKRPCVNTQPENIEIGSDMMSQWQDVITQPAQDNVYYCVLCLTSDLTGKDSSTTITNGVATQYRYYIIPYNISSGAGFTEDSGAMYFSSGGKTTPLASVKIIYDLMRSGEDLVNKCVAIYITASLPRLLTSSENTITQSGSNYHIETRQISGQTYAVITTSGGRMFNMWTGYSESDFETSKTFPITAMFGTYNETKLYWYPYSYIQLTDNNGTFKSYKNELWNNGEAKFVVMGNIGSSSVEYIPIDYKVKNYGSIFNPLRSDADAFVQGYEMDMPIISDYTAALMQSSRNSMNANVSNTIRSNETSMQIANATNSAQNQLTQVQNGLNLTTTSNNNLLNSKLTQIGISANAKKAELQVANQAVNSIGSVLTGNILGGVAGGASQMLTTGANFAIETNQARATARVQNQAATANANVAANTNDLTTEINNQLRSTTTRYQAQTNIQNALASYTAQLHDAQATADSIVSGGSNMHRYISLGFSSPLLVAYRLNPEYQAIVEQIFKVRGYATNRYKKPYLKTRENWNYIQTVKCNIESTGIEESDLEKIKMAFNNGITLWHTKDVGDYSKTNKDLTTPEKVDKYGDLK